MDVLNLPIWGQLSFLGLSIGLNVYFIIRRVMGDLVSAAELIRAQQVTDTFRQAWEKSEETKHEAAQLLTKLTVTAETMERVLNALPPVQTARVVVSHDAEGGDS